MSYNGRRILTPGASKKRKERETQGSKGGEPVCSNRLLAGYMAYEFLTKGTLLGQKFDPARAQAVPVAGSSAEPSVKKEHQNYAEVASILKTDRTHIAGIVNPMQLARWIQM